MSKICKFCSKLMLTSLEMILKDVMLYEVRDNRNDDAMSYEIKGYIDFL